MILLRFMNLMPVWVLIAIVLGGFEIYSVGLMLACRRIFGVDRMKLNNEVAGFKFSVIGVLYAVLLAFVVVAVWENYNTTELTVRNEAKAVGNLTQLSYALPDPQGSGLRAAVADYANKVEQFEWPTMARGLPSKETSHALAHLTQAIFDMQTGDFRSLAMFQQALHLLAVIEDNRNERLDSADGSVPPLLWLVLLAGALITLGYPAFFGTSNVFAQTLMTATLAALVSLALLPALILDFPFTGDIVIEPTAFTQALQQMPPHEGEHPPAGVEAAPSTP